MITICVPTLRRYDLLGVLAESLNQSTVPVQLSVIDNGQRYEMVTPAASKFKGRWDVFCPAKPMGVAEAWNWFIDNVPEERVIANDDVSFGLSAVEKLVGSKADLALVAGLGFACFLLRDSCVRTVGRFDETISPGYGYYEDCDYLQRIDGKGTKPWIIEMEDVVCEVKHYHSATIKGGRLADLEEHHRKFKIAQANYMRKWGLETL